MKFTDTLQDVLQNFSSINQSIVFKPGNVVSTISPMKTVIAKAKTDVSFDSSFAIYNLGQFLSTISLFDDPQLTILDSSMSIESGSEKVNYTFSEPSLIIQPPEKDIKFPSVDVEFKLKNDDLKKTLKAASVLQSSELAVTGDGEKIYLEAINLKDKSSNKYRVAVGETDKNFRMVFLVEHIKVLPRDYDVKISAKGLSHFVAEDVEYYIAVEATSTFEG